MTTEPAPDPKHLSQEAAAAFQTHRTSETDDLVARYLRSHPGSWERRSPWHPTVSVVVLTPPGDRTLLVRHPRWGWKQTGGHLEAQDTSLAGAALRELEEEGGIQDALRVEVCRVSAFFGPMCDPRVPDGAHLDVCHLVAAEEVAPSSLEGHEVAWWDTEDALEVVDAGARAMLLAAAQLTRR